MDYASSRLERGNAMSLYIVTTILAVAASVFSMTDLVLTIEQPDGARATLMVRP